MFQPNDDGLRTPKGDVMHSAERGGLPLRQEHGGRGLVSAPQHLILQIQTIR